MNWKLTGALCIVSVIIGIFLSHSLWPQVTTKVETKEQVVVKDRIVTVIKREKTATGTRTEITRSEDKDVKENRTAKTEVTKAAAAPTWRVSAGIDLQQRPIGVIEYRVLGPVHVGLIGSGAGTFGAIVGVEF